MLTLPATMPVQLSSLRFLAGGTNEEKYFLFSDTFLLNDDESLNEFRFDKMKNNDTYARVYVEDDGFGLEVTCKDPAAATEK